MAGADDKDFARASLARMILFQLAEGGGPGKSSASFDVVRKAHVKSGHKRDLLAELRRDQGLEGLVKVADHLEKVRFDPVWSVALQARTPKALLEGWRRMEKYSHARNRVRFTQDRDGYVECQRYRRGGGIPALEENLLICGVMAGLLRRIGCRDLTCTLVPEQGDQIHILKEGYWSICEEGLRGKADHWIFQWPQFERQQRDWEILNSYPAPDMPPCCGFDSWATIQGVIKIIGQYPSHPWRLSEMAQETQLSIRTLQRRLEEGGQNFSRLVRTVRVQHACRQLEKTDMTITEAGFVSGFSDSAQFSRDFRASMGLSPSAYREASQNL